MVQTTSKLPNSKRSIFSVVAELSKKHQAINLGQGFPDFEVSKKLKTIVAKHLHRNKDQYAPMAGVPELRSVLANKYETAYGQKINWETEITITAGATQGIFTIIQAFIGVGDEVIIIEPAYDSYGPSIEIAGGIPISYQMTETFKIDWTAVAQLITAQTKMIVLNNPHNPSGQILNEEDLLALSRMVKETNILILSDEVYEHLVYDKQNHQSILRFPELFQRSLAVYSFGKTFHATGWKMGYVIAPEHLMNIFRNVHQWNVFSVNSYVQYALAEYLEDESTYLELGAFYQQKRDLFSDAMRQSRFKEIPSFGSYFQLYDYSAISEKTDIEFMEWLIKEHGVASIPIPPFYTDHKDHKVIRFCFAKKEATLKKALDVLQKI